MADVSDEQLERLLEEISQVMEVMAADRDGPEVGDPPNGELPDEEPRQSATADPGKSRPD